MGKSHSVSWSRGRVSDVTHILHVIRSLGSGGAERQIVDLVKNLDPTRFKHTVCYFTSPNHFAADIRSAGGTVINLNLKGKRPWFSASLALRRILKELKPTVVHSWLCDATLSCRLALLGNSAPPSRIVSLCGPDYEPEVIRVAQWSQARMKTLQWIDRYSGYLFREHFVACSQYIEASAKLRLGIQTKHITTIYNSVDPDSLDSSPLAAEHLRRRLNIPATATVYIAVGRLDPQKGHEFLIRAFSQLHSKVGSSHLILIGEGGLELPLKQLVTRLNIESSVHFLGVRSDIGTCLKMSDVFVFPSLFEGFGMALIEAMFLGIPVIASRVGPIPEIISNDSLGALVPPGEVEPLADAMLAFFHNIESRRAMGLKGQSNSLKRFSSKESIIPAWTDLYRRLSGAVS